MKEWQIKSTCNGNEDKLEKNQDESLCDEISSNITIKLENQPKLRECISEPFDNKSLAFVEKFYKFQVPREAKIESDEFCIDKFIVGLY